MDQTAVRGRLSRPLVRSGMRAALGRIFAILLACWLIATLVPSEGYLGPAYTDLVINRAIGSHGFRLGAWEIQAWKQKIEDAANRPGADLSPASQHDLVVGYFAAIDRVDELQRSIERLYADPHQASPREAAAPLQAEIDRLRAEHRAQRPAVERILQGQVARVIRDAGLITSGVLWPPVLFHFSESPDVLVVSPRDRITLANSAFVEPGAAVTQMELMEDGVEKDLGVSALVEGTGGFSAYPTMVVEYGDLEWVLSTIAHEWFHTYLVFYPLGWHYFDDGATRTLNETSASIFGDELGAEVLRRFYPELVPAPAPVRPAPSASADAAPAFSFGATMRATRLKVDRLLREGKIAEAERYMEAQRQVIVSHGYVLRKLNQAYFAFHGSYAVGAAATDPIGDKLRALRDRSASLRLFVETVRGITSVSELDAALARR